MNQSILNFLHFQTPTSEQKIALEALTNFVKETNNEDFFVLSGAAGTGKTSITSALIGYLNNMDISFKIAAPTGRAARILGKKTNTVSNTIHSMIYTPSVNKEIGSIKWILKNNSVKDYTVYIVDEASMIGSKKASNNEMFETDDSLLNHLAKFIKAGNEKNKIIFLGDRNQLPPYDEQTSEALDPNYLRNTFKWKGGFHYLTEVKRVEDGSYILKNATNLRRAIDENSHSIPPINAISLKNVWAAATDFAKDYTPDGFDKAIAIGRSCKCNNIFNKEVRNKIFGYNVPLITKGDLLIVQNNWKRGDFVLYNGDHVIVEEIDLTNVEVVTGLHFAPVKIKAQNLNGDAQIIEDYLLLDLFTLEDGKISFLAENNLRAERFRKNRIYSDSGNSADDRYVGALRLGYGYSITCQKAQGGEWDDVYINTFAVKDKKWLYTAVTRAKSELSIF